MLKNRRPGEQASLSAPTQCYGVRRVLTKLSVNLGLTIATPWSSHEWYHNSAVYAVFGRLSAPVVITTPLCWCVCLISDSVFSLLYTINKHVRNVKKCLGAIEHYDHRS